MADILSAAATGAQGLIPGQNTMVLVTYLILFCIILAAPAYIIHRKMKYSVRAFVRVPHGDGYYQKTFFGAETIDRRTGQKKFLIDGYKRYSGEPVPQEYFFPLKLTIRFTKAVYGKMDNDGNIAWQKGMDHDNSLKFFGLTNTAADFGIRQMHERDEAWQKKQDNLQRLLPVILMVLFVISAGVSGYSAWTNTKAAKEFSAASSTQAASTSALIQTFYGAGNKTTGGPVITPFNNVIG